MVGELIEGKKQKTFELNLKKEIALFILNKCNDKFNNSYYQILMNKINNTKNIITLDVITRHLSQSLCFGDKININSIDDKIKTEIEIANFCDNI